MTEDEETLAEVLEHHEGVGRTGGGTWGCICGHVLANSKWSAEDRFRRHLVSVLASWLAAHLAAAREQAAAEALAGVRALADEWAAEGDEMSHWFAAQVLYDTVDVALRAALPAEPEGSDR